MKSKVLLFLLARATTAAGNCTSQDNSLSSGNKIKVSFIYLLFLSFFLSLFIYCITTASILQILRGGKGGSFTRFTSIKDDQLRFTVNNIPISRFTEYNIFRACYMYILFSPFS